MRWRDSGTRFDNARTAVPLTLPAHVTLMTGSLPPVHSVHENGVVFAPRPAAVLLRRRFRDAGYQTGAFVGAYVLDRRFGLADGFDTYDDRIRTTRTRARGSRPNDREGKSSMRRSAGSSQARSPFFLWVHLYDPHAPYEPPAEYLSKAGGNAYDGEVAYADAQAGRLFEALTSRGLTTSHLRSRLPAITVKAWAITASRRTACSRTTRRCACR